MTKTYIVEQIITRLNISKRQLFVGSTLLLTLALISTQIVSGGLRWEIVLVLMALTYGLASVALREDLNGIEYLTLLTLPTFYTAAVYLFYFLLPTRWLTRLPIAFLYAIGMYAILLTENIYNVAASTKNIQLLRAAHSVGFLLTLLTHFFLIETLLSLHLPFYLNALFGVIIVAPLCLQALWSMELHAHITAQVWLGTLVTSLVIGQLLIIFSFWPIRITIEALFLTTVFYTLVGMIQQYLVERLFTKTTREFLIVLAVVFILVLFTTKWGSGIQ